MTVHYEFPTLMHIEDVLPHIDDCFRVVEKDCGNTYINYVKMGNETFPAFVLLDSEEHGYTGAELHNLRAAVRRECRGLAFNTQSGKLVSRPFHKFFNVGEREDMDIAVLNFDRAHVVQDKVDGSMIRPIPTPAGLRWGTKMGVTDTAILAETWLIDHPQYAEMAETCMDMLDMTPLFEYVSPENRIVVDYGKRDMILLAVRDNLTGTYMDQKFLNRMGEKWNVPVVGTYDPVEGDPTIYLSAVKNSDDLDEGIVIQWSNGHRAKVKTETYSILHKVKEAGRTERTLVTAILDGKVDDLLPLISGEERDRVEDFIKRFWECMARLEDDILTIYSAVREGYETKKDFALASDHWTSMERGLMFGLWDGKIADAKAAAQKVIAGGLTSETKWAEMRENIAMASNLRDFYASWHGSEDIE